MSKRNNKCKRCGCSYGSNTHKRKCMGQTIGAIRAHHRELRHNLNARSWGWRLSGPVATGSSDTNRVAADGDFYSHPTPKNDGVPQSPPSESN